MVDELDSLTTVEVVKTLSFLPAVAADVTLFA